MTVMCKGSLSLGTGCGVCSRCVEESGVDDKWIAEFYPSATTAAERSQVRKDIVAMRVKLRAQASDPDAAFNRPAGAKWGMGDLVAKKRGSKWRGKVVGFYTTDVTRIGYCVESFFEVGSVQVWPEDALVGWEPLAGVPEPTSEPSLFNARVASAGESHA